MAWMTLMTARMRRLSGRAAGKTLASLGRDGPSRALRSSRQPGSPSSHSRRFWLGEGERERARARLRKQASGENIN